MLRFIQKTLIATSIICYFLLFCESFKSFGLKARKFKINAITERPTIKVESNEDSNVLASKASGRAHSDESRAKISIANKGKTPWNYGKSHSEETKKRIAEKTREAMERKKLEKASQLGMTIEQFELNKKVEKKKKAVSMNKGGLTEDGRRRISESLKKRWQDPEYRDRILNSGNTNRTHSHETRARISESIKKKWQDQNYRCRVVNSPSEEVRARISATLKAKWLDPKFREKMMNSTFERTDKWRESISIKIRAKWEDKTYRLAVTDAIRRSFGENSTRAYSYNRSKPRRKIYKTPQEKAEALEKVKEVKRIRRENEIAKRQIFNEAKNAKKSGLNSSIKELLGGQLWFEEKMKRRKDGLGFIDDEKLEEELLEEWSNESENFLDGDETSDDKYDEDDEDDDLLDELTDADLYDSISESYENQLISDLEEEEFLDIIEVYDETGELIATYDSAEYAKLKASK